LVIDSHNYLEYMTLQLSGQAGRAKTVFVEAASRR